MNALSTALQCILSVLCLMCVCVCVCVAYVCHACCMPCCCWRSWWLFWGYVTLSSSTESGSVTFCSDICSSCSTKSTRPYAIYVYINIYTHTLPTVYVVHWCVWECPAGNTCCLLPAPPWQMLEYFQRWHTQCSAKLF